MMIEMSKISMDEEADQTEEQLIYFTENNLYTTFFMIAT